MTGSTEQNQHALMLLETVWGSMADLGDGLTEAEWKTATACPGWSVQDQLSHIIGMERMLAGEDTEQPTQADHVRNAAGEWNEGQVAARRSMTGAEVLEEFRAITDERLDQLRALPTEKWDEVGPTPAGEGPYRYFMETRAFDSWVHEQDMRRALDRPGHLEGPVVDHAIGWHLRNMGYVIGKKVGPPEGSSVVLRVGPYTQALVVEGRATPVPEPPDDPTVTLSTDVATFDGLASGRLDPEDVLAAGAVAISGDDELGARIVRQLNYMF